MKLPAGADGVFISDTHISEFTIGIDIPGSGFNLIQARISDVMVESWTYGVRIAPSSSAGQIYQVFFSDCIFQMQPDSSEPNAIGVLIDTDGGALSNVSDIFLNNCMCYRWSGPGVQINVAQNIVITGGRYGSNATSQPSSGGIAITGAAVNVTVTGADCSPEVPNPAGGTFGAQPHALSVTAAVEGLYVRGCNFMGYTSSPPVYASGAGTQVEITDCAGYNDQGTILQSGTTSPATIKNTIAWANVPQGWFGPIAFYITGAGNVSIGNATTQVNTHLTDGGYELSPGEEAVIANAGNTTHFLAIGK